MRESLGSGAESAALVNLGVGGGTVPPKKGAGLLYEVAAELDAILGDAVDDLEFTSLVDRVVAARISAASTAA